MLLSYFRIAWKVMLRNKFFTCISLFGISFTIMILTVVMALIDLLVGDNYPENNRHRTLYINAIYLSKEGSQSYQKVFSSLSHEFISRYVLTLQTPEIVSVYAQGMFNKLMGNQMKGFMIKYTDAQVWNIMNFDFVEGRPFTKPDVDKASRVAVINESMRDIYFGKKKVTGEYIEKGELKFQIIGVVKNPPVGFAYADIWVPLTLNEKDEAENSLTGNYHAIVLARDKSDIQKIKAEYDGHLKKVAFPDPNKYNKIESWAATPLETVLGFTHIGQFLVAFIFLACLFIAIPSINLININISRIMERSSEIGVRKAYGASSADLVAQFVFENVLLSIIGGILGFAMAIIAADLLVDLINYVSPVFQIPYGQFQLNWRIAVYCLMASVLFGLLSGVYPAYRMSRMHPVEALRGGEV
jgi:putative ABC transport system permease protein